MKVILIASALILIILPLPVQAEDPSLSCFSVFATNSVWVKENATVHSGNIGALDVSPGPWLDSQSEVTIGKKVYIEEGAKIYGDSVKIKLNASVYDVTFNELTNNGTVRGDEIHRVEWPLKDMACLSLCQTVYLHEIGASPEPAKREKDSTVEKEPDRNKPEPLV